MSDLAYRAMMFAREAHKMQVRKYTRNRYVDHLAEVEGIVATVTPTDDPDRREAMIAIAWLHDTIEDRGTSYREIFDLFGGFVAESVLRLSDMETEGNRAARKAASRERLAKSAAYVQTIKCADLISNTSSIVMHDPSFAVVYLKEKRLLLDVLTKADSRLLELARSQTVEAS